MPRIWIVGIILLASSPALHAQTTASGKNVRIWNSFIIANSNLALTEAPRNTGNKMVGVINDQEAFDTLWKAWRTEPSPKQDFSKHLVLVMTHTRHGKVEFMLELDPAGALDVRAKTVGRRLDGMTYVISIVPRDGIKSIGGTPAPAAK